MLLNKRLALECCSLCSRLPIVHSIGRSVSKSCIRRSGRSTWWWLDRWWNNSWALSISSLLRIIANTWIGLGCLVSLLVHIVITEITQIDNINKVDIVTLPRLTFLCHNRLLLLVTLLADRIDFDNLLGLVWLRSPWWYLLRNLSDLGLVVWVLIKKKVLDLRRCLNGYLLYDWVRLVCM